MEESIGDDEILEALDALEAGTAEVGDVLLLAHASMERDEALVPDVVIAAVAARHEAARDVTNGGLDQFVWNHGVERARAVADAWCRVGAVENGELVHRLADALSDYQEEVGAAAIQDSPVQNFLAYRARVEGPYFGIPEPDEELGEAVLEWALENAALAKLE